MATFTTIGSTVVPSGSTVSCTLSDGCVTWAESAKTGDYVVTAADTGTVFTNAGASGAVAFTLPTKAAGLTYIFLAVANQAISVVSAGSADDIVGWKDAACDSIAFSTANKIIGAGVRVTCNADATLWYCQPFTWNDATDITVATKT